jgi:hypothetical protein
MRSGGAQIFAAARAVVAAFDDVGFLSVLPV